jgi:phenylacetate-CoA ligase
VTARRDPLRPVAGRLVAPALEARRGGHARRFLAQEARLLRLPARAQAETARRRIRGLLLHAWRTTRFYRDRLAGAGLEPPAFGEPGVLARIPPLRRHEMAAEADRLLSDAWRGRALQEAESGGTTSRPVAFLQDLVSVARKDAAAAVLRRDVGWEPGMRQAFLWGAVHEVPGPPRGLSGRVKALFRLLLADRAIFLPAMDLDAPRLDRYLDLLERHRPDVLQAYPSAADLLARHALAAGRRVPVPLVMLTAETVYPSQRDHVRRAFGARVTSFYGARECGWIASECRAGAQLHVNTAGVHLEEETDGRLLVTDLVNRAMPLVRYDLGDRGRIDPEPCSCGDPRPVLAALEGRANDVFVLPSGRRVPGSLVDTRNFSIGGGVLEAQFVQRERDRIEVRYVTGTPFRPESLDAIRERTLLVLGNEVRLDFTRVDRIEAGPNGKVRYCVALPAGEAPGGAPTASPPPSGRPPPS